MSDCNEILSRSQSTDTLLSTEKEERRAKGGQGRGGGGGARGGKGEREERDSNYHELRRKCVCKGQ